MAQAGAHAIVGMYASRFPFFNKKWTPAIIIGSLIPDLDIIAVAFGKLFTSISEPIHYFHRKGTHSLLFVLFIFLIFEILSEILKNPKLRHWGKGLSIGITTHIILDSFLFLQSIYLFWPLQMDLNIWKNYNPPEMLPNFMMAMEFLFFRILAWIIIEIGTHKRDIRFPGLLPLISKWRKVEFLLFVVFIILTLINLPFYDVLFGIFYIPSLFISIFVVWIMRDIFYNEEIGNQF